MGRKAGIWSTVLIMLSGCSPDEIYLDRNREICISITGEDMSTRAAEPDENLLSDLTLMIFDDNGHLEYIKEFGKEELRGQDAVTFNADLLMYKEYSIYACANTGMTVRPASLDELYELKCHIAYPDEYREGIPMAAKAEDIMIDESISGIELTLERLMAKISLRIDRGGLSDDVRMNVISARIGNCPRSAYLFRNNAVSSHDECFATGFTRAESECRILNRNIGNALSGELTFYMLENMQGRFSSDGIDKDSDKVFSDRDIRRETCSYIELRMDYESDSHHSISSPLIYRFYLGEDRNSLDVERNCHYHITVIPEDDGLPDEGWRVDKTGISPKDEDISFEMTPSGYIQGHVGEQINVRCSFNPPDAEFSIGMEELEYDRERGIYDYTIDDDGHGVTLTLMSPGTGIIYMTAGAPINREEMLVIEVNNIKN